MHEVFEHTADLGLRIRAASLDTLLAEAGEALFATLVEDLGTVQPAQEIEVRLPPDEPEFLLFDWLNSLLYRFDTEHLLLCRFAVTVGPEGLLGKAWGEPLDRGRHEPGHEVKAITYHGLKVEQTSAGWLAEVIIDI
jgi:SHS2 domain-containing protein